MKTSSAKAKGRKLQQLVAKKISELTGIPHGKDCLIESREMGQSGVDVKLIGEARDKFPFSIECKNCEKWTMSSFIDQAKSNIMPDTMWLLVMGKNRAKPVVCMDLDDFFEIISNNLY